jgi:hypothetical protein
MPHLAGSYQVGSGRASNASQDGSDDWDDTKVPPPKKTIPTTVPSIHDIINFMRTILMGKFTFRIF